jgi:hypothetical protein
MITEKIHNLILNNHLEEALSEISDDLHQIAEDKTVLSTFIDAKDVDNLCQEIGKKIISGEKKTLDLCKKPFDQKLNVYITGEVYIHGGHTREIEDWINHTYSDRKNIIIISRPLQNSHKEQIEKLKSQNIQFIYNELGGNRTQYIKWLQLQLAKLRPDVIFVSTTPTDIVSLAALQPELINKLYWNLSLDHGVSIGIHIKSITKIIVKRPYLYFYLKDKLKLSSPIYIPLNRPDVIGKIDQYVSTDQQKKIVTCSCTSSAHKIESDYRYKFTDVIPNILKITEGHHIHIGAISSNSLQNLYDNMDKLGLDRNKFVHIKWVDSLAKALIENDVDILLHTFPIGGGLVTIEAMEAGKMLINHRNYGSYLFNLSDFCYEGVFSWSEPEELYSYLKSLTRDEIIKHSKISRRHYEQNHQSENLKDISDVNKMNGVEVESRRAAINEQFNYGIDYYQKYFDDLPYKKEAKNHWKETPEIFVKDDSRKKKTLGEKYKNSCQKRLNFVISLIKKNE